MAACFSLCLYAVQSLENFFVQSLRVRNAAVDDLKVGQAAVSNVLEALIECTFCSRRPTRRLNLHHHVEGVICKARLSNVSEQCV